MKGLILAIGVLLVASSAAEACGHKKARGACGCGAQAAPRRMKMKCHKQRRAACAPVAESCAPTMLASVVTNNVYPGVAPSVQSPMPAPAPAKTLPMPQTPAKSGY